MKLREIMRTSPITATTVMRLGDAFRLMEKSQIRHLPVVDDRRLCGILSERDILRYRAETAFREDWWRAPVAAAMVAPAQTAGPDDSLTEAAGRFATAKIGALPIVEHGDLIGMITLTDVLAAEVREAMA
jgi:acetoin utilization protein AcuB